MTFAVPARATDGLTVLLAHPSPDLYGSDRQMVRAADGLRAAGWRVVVCLPGDGPLVPILHGRGFETQFVRFPILRKALFSPLGLLKLLLSAPAVICRLVRLIRTIRPDVVYVNTVTIPIWVVAARLARRPVLVHVREAEEDWPRAVRVGLSAPLLLASSIVANSAASKRVLIDSVPSLAAKTLVIYNGMPGPRPTESSGAPPRVPGRLALVARLSPRKGVDVALEAVALLRQQGRAVTLDVCGSVYPGYEWFEEQLRERASQDDLAGAVRFAGYVNPTWPVLATASVVLVPSRVEPFGNAAVEGLLAARPVVASDVQGLAEIIEDGRTGLLVPAGDADALAATIGRLLDDEDFALRLAVQGRVEAHERFAVDRYHREIIDAVAAISSKPAVPQDVMSAG